MASDSEGLADSAGYQSASDQPATSERVPDEERIDPFRAFAESAAKVAEERRREKERHEPVSRDSWTRGNPQVSVRLRPLDFDRLRRAADLYGVRPTTLARMMVIRGVRAILDADLRKLGDEFRERRNY